MAGHDLAARRAARRWSARVPARHIERRPRRSVIRRRQWSASGPIELRAAPTHLSLSGPVPIALDIGSATLAVVGGDLALGVTATVQVDGIPSLPPAHPRAQPWTLTAMAAAPPGQPPVTVAGSGPTLTFDVDASVGAANWLLAVVTPDGTTLPMVAAG